MNAIEATTHSFTYEHPKSCSCFSALCRLVTRILFRISENEGPSKWGQLKKTVSSETNKRLALQHIHRAREPSTDRELERLRHMDALTVEQEQNLDSIFRNNPEAKMLFSQAQEIRNLLSDTHDVFIHAQSTKWLILTHLIKELFKSTGQHAPQFKFLRDYNTEKKEVLLGSKMFAAFKNFFKKSEPETLAKFLKENDHISDEHNPEQRKRLISCDAYFYNNATAESASYFLDLDSSILDDQDTITTLAIDVITNFNPDVNRVEAKNRVKSLLELLPQKSRCGNLYAICVPKDRTFEFQYRSHAFGSVCKCYQEAQEISRLILDTLQKNDPETWQCQNHPYIPQFRLFAPALQPNEDVMIRLLTCNREESKAIKDKARSIAKWCAPQTKEQSSFSLKKFFKPNFSLPAFGDVYKTKSQVKKL